MDRVIIALTLLFSFELSAQTCSDKIKKISDLDLTENLTSDFEAAFPSALGGLKENHSYSLFYKNTSKGNVIFMGTEHSGFMVGDKRAAVNQNVINTIRLIKTPQNIKTIIVENNKEQIDQFKGSMNTELCQNEVCKEQELGSAPVKRSILTENEIHSAIWIADPLRENIDVVGGETIDSEIQKILTSIAGVSKKDYNYYDITDCLSQIGDNQTYKSMYKTWTQAYDFCTAQNKLLAYRGDEQRAAYEKWFAEKSKQQPYPYIKVAECKKSDNVDLTSIKSIFENSACYSIRLPKDISNKNSISYIFGMVLKIRNYCLIQNILSSMNKGNVFVLYGSSHLAATYKALKKDICTTAATTPTASTCPTPVEDIKKM